LSILLVELALMGISLSLEEVDGAVDVYLEAGFVAELDRQ